MDAQLPPPLQPLPVASGGIKPKASNRIPKTPKGKGKQAAGIPEWPFDNWTPESYREQLARKEKRSYDQFAQDEANVPCETNVFNQTPDLTDDWGKDSNKKAKTINEPSEAGVPGTTPGGKKTTEVKPVKRNVGGRPRKNPVKEPSKKPLHFLRKNNPVKVEICSDIWDCIFDVSPPEFLLQARQTNIQLQHLLRRYPSIWKKSRKSTYGFDHPDPPPGLNEAQYADLLTGVGCQGKGCPEKSTRKVYWAFQRRWCSECLETSTTKETDLTNVLEKYPSFTDCIPKVTFDSWNRYCWVGDLSQKPAWAQNAGAHIRYSCLALTNFIRDFDEFLAVGPSRNELSEEEKDSWVDSRVEKNRILVNQLQRIEAYVETEKQRKKNQAAAIKAAREDFFRERALKLNPPLSAEALAMLKPYQTSVDIPKLPTERSWDELLPKLDKERAEAESRIVADSKLAENPDIKRRMSQEYKRILENRKQNTTSEQRFVLELAEKVMNAVEVEVESGSVAHVDFVPLVFRRIFEEYNSIHVTGKPGNYEGCPYVLVLDDARMVYETLIAKAIDRWNDQAKRAAKYLKCSGCKRKDSHRLHEFEPLIIHIGQRHTGNVGTLSYFLPQPSTVPDRGAIPWCRLKWPRNLPILASHRDVTGEWDPDDKEEYIHAPCVEPLKPTQDAFQGRAVIDGENPPRGDFIEDVIHAASLFDGKRIAPKFKTQIVLKFALDRHNNAAKNFGAESAVPIQALKDLPTALIRAGILGLFHGFMCKTCCADDAREKRNNRFANKKHSLGEMIKHFLADHEHSSWSSDLFQLPSAEELWEALMKPGMKQAYQAFTSLFPETEEVMDPATEWSKAALHGPNLVQTTRPAKGLHIQEQASVPSWRDALWTAGSSGQPSVFMS